MPQKLRTRPFQYLLLGLLCLFALQNNSFGSVLAAENTEDTGLFDLSLDQIMDIEVISVTRTKGQDIFTSPAAIYVITQEDIRRSGLRSIPELLRLVPGVQVSRIRADQWAISARGFTERFSDKLLVQIDGRTIYNMVFSGVVWEIQDYVLEDIERIEVIRGPGASLWGANAVHGIINIITKDAKDTQGGYFNGGGGNYDAIGELRYGGKAGPNAWYRAYGKHRYSDSFPSAHGDFTDDYGLTTMGFRLDFDDGGDDTYTVELGAFEGRFSTLFPNVDLSAGTNFLQDAREDQYGGNIRGLWEHRISETSATKLQAYFNTNSLAIPDNQIDFRAEWNLFDIDFQHNFHLNENNAIVWGMGYRRGNFSSRGSETISFSPSARQIDVINGFVQDCFPVFTDKLRGIVGVKLQHNDFTGFEYQPTTRLTYRHDDRNVFWASWSRAVRIPNHANRDLVYTRRVLAPDTALFVLGDRDIQSERINSYEAGYRSKVTDKLTLDLTAFLMNGDSMADIGSAGPIGFRFNNDITANTEGIELAVDYQASPTWRLKGTYSWFHLEITKGGKGSEDNTPQNMFSLSSYKNFTKDLELNTNIFFQDGVDRDQGPDPAVPAWLRVDTGLVWHAKEGLDFSVWAQNLFDSKHQEFSPDNFINTGASEIPRSIFFQMRYHF